MYIIYLFFAVVLVVSFITGNIIMYKDYKRRSQQNNRFLFQKID